LSEAKYDVLGIGNAIVDVLARADDGFLARRGLTKGAMQLIDEAGAKALYADMAPAVEVSGGSAANTIAGIAAFGGCTAFFGKVRDDQLGEVFTHDIRSLGTVFETQAATAGPATARCLVLVTPDGERTLNTYLGASTGLGPDDVDEDMVAAARVTYLEGYLWDPPHAKEAFRKAAGAEVVMLWHKDRTLPAGLDVIGLPGGFCFGDYLRPGAIAARAPITDAVVAFAGRGGPVIGICNGFQVLLEAGLLPGALMRNAGLKFVCRPVPLTVVTPDSPFTSGHAAGQAITLPVAHHDGNYTADAATLQRLRDEDRIAFRYRDNPNGSADDIAGILSPNRRVLGLMPHPERAIDRLHGGTDGAALFAALVRALAPA